MLCISFPFTLALGRNNKIQQSSVLSVVALLFNSVHRSSKRYENPEKMEEYICNALKLMIDIHGAQPFIICWPRTYIIIWHFNVAQASESDSGSDSDSGYELC